MNSCFLTKKKVKLLSPCDSEQKLCWCSRVTSLHIWITNFRLIWIWKVKLWGETVPFFCNHTSNPWTMGPVESGSQSKFIFLPILIKFEKTVCVTFVFSFRHLCFPFCKIWRNILLLGKENEFHCPCHSVFHLVLNNYSILLVKLFFNFFRVPGKEFNPTWPSLFEHIQ